MTNYAAKTIYFIFCIKTIYSAKTKYNPKLCVKFSAADSTCGFGLFYVFMFLLVCYRYNIGFYTINNGLVTRDGHTDPDLKIWSDQEPLYKIWSESDSV